MGVNQEGTVAGGDARNGYELQTQTGVDPAVSEQIEHRVAAGVQARTIELTEANDRLARQVEEHEQVEHTLRESEHRLHTIVNSILTGVLIVDAQTHQIVDVNPHAAEIIGLPRDQILGRVCHRFICPAEKGRCPIGDLGQTVDRSERCLLRADGAQVPVLKSVVSSAWEGREYLIESFVDISRLKHAEDEVKESLRKVAEINEELSHFAYVVSHDLKAPLRGIQLVTEWLCEDYGDKLGAEAKEQMTLLQSRVNRMHNLIDGVLQYSRVGQLKEDLGEVNLNELLPLILDAIAPPEHIHVTVQSDLPTLTGEKTRITQVFQNLLSNAVKFMDKPQGEIHIGCVAAADFWKFGVTDNGPGIEEKHFERIFRIFQTLAPKDEYESTGVGLTLAKKIVEMYGGKIWVESEVGQGSTFFFTFPQGEMSVSRQVQASVAN